MNLLWQRAHHFRNTNFVRRVATLQVGSFGGTFIQAVIGIFLARLLQPELFGLYSLAFGLASLASVFLGAGFQDAMTSVIARSYAEKDKQEVKNSFSFLFKISLITSIIALVLSLFLPLIADRFYDNSKIGDFASIIVYGSIISTLLFSICLIGLQVTGKIRQMAILVSADQAFRYGIALILVMLGFEVYGAVAGHLYGALVLAFISFFVWRRLAYEFSLFPTFKEVIEGIVWVPLKKYLGFSLWVTLDRNLSNVYMALPVILTGIYVAPGEVTFFKLAFGFVNLGLSLLGPISTMLNVEFPRIHVESRDKLLKHFIRISFFSLGISALLTAGAVALSPLAFKLLYGDAFLPSIKLVFGLFLYGGLFGLGVGLGPMWRAINKVKISIVINLIVLGLGIPLALVLIRSYGLWGAVATVTIWFTSSHLISFIYLAKELKKVESGDLKV